MTNLQELLEDLQHPEPGVRLPAIHALVESGSPVATDALKRLLWDDRLMATHAATLRALGRIGGDEVVEPIANALNHDHATVRDTAASVLGDLGNPLAVEPLITALQTGAGVLRASAAEALGKIGDARAVEPLITALRRDDRGDVRFFAAEALGQMRDTRAVGPLIGALDDPGVIYGGSVAEAAAAALAEFDNDDARAAVIQWREVWELPGDATQIATLIERLQNPAWEARHVAAYMLGELGDVRAVEPLISALEDDDAVVQIGAADALGKLGDPRAVEELVDVLSSSVIDVRRAVVNALGALHDDRAVGVLIDLLSDTVGDLDFAVADALEQIGGKEAERAVSAWRKKLEQNPRFPPPKRGE